MAGLFILSLFILISSFVILGSGWLVYNHSYLGHLHSTRQLPRWENTLYYALVVYPIASTVFIYIAGVFFLVDNKVDTKAETWNMLIFCAGHFLLSILSVTVAQYLKNLHKVNVIFIITSVIAGGGYLYAGVFAINNLLKH